MDIQKHLLNWLQIITADIPDSASTTIQIMVKAWSVMETAETNGLSHFLEHMFFKWGKRYPTPKSVAQALDTLGADYNAFTGEEYAGYYVKCAPMFVEKAIDVLSDMLVNTQFPEAELEREKGVIVQEIKMYEDMPNRMVWDKWKHRYYGETSYGRPILWPVDNVLRFTQQDLLDHKQALYTKDNLVIIVTGKITDMEVTLGQISEQFGSLPQQVSISRPEFIHTLPSTNQQHFQQWTQQHHLIIWCKWVSMFDDQRYAYRILSTILGGTMSSRLFQHIREQQGLCYYIWASHSSSTVDGTTMIYAGMEKERREQGLEAIYNELEILRKTGITDDEFDQARSNIQGSTVMGLETSDEVAGFLGRQALLRDEIISLDQILSNYMNVTKEEINAAAKSLVRDQMYAYWIE